MRFKPRSLTVILSLGLILAFLLWVIWLTAQPATVAAQSEATPTPNFFPSAGASDPVSLDSQTNDVGIQVANKTQQSIQRIETYNKTTNLLTIYTQHQITGDFSSSSSWYFGVGSVDLLGTPIFTRTGTATCNWVEVRKRVECSGSLTGFTYSYRWQTTPTIASGQFDLSVSYSWSGARADITYDFYYPASLTLTKSTLPPALNETSRLRWITLDTTQFQSTLTFDIGSYTITGRVTGSNGSPLGNVTLTTGAGQTAVTGSDGTYTLTGLAEGEHTVTPSRGGYSFSPAFRTVSVGPDNATGIDFVGSADPRLEVSPNQLRFYTTTGSNPASQTFTVRNAGSGSLSWQAQESIPWLSLSLSSGTAPRSVTASINAAGLNVGVYTGQIILTSNQAVNSPLTLNVTLSVGCNPRRDADVMVVLDVSGSMRGQPLVDAKTAALAFLDRMDLSRDQVGLVSFNSGAALNAQLTQNDANIRATINGLVANGNTDIAEAVQVARAELKSGRANSSHQPVIILLSDGRQTVSGNPIAEAQAAKNEGIQLVTIGLGSADTATLRTMASTNLNYYYTPTSGELADIYEQISVTVGCSILAVSPNGLEYTYSLGGVAPAPQTLRVENSAGQTLDWNASETLSWLSLDTSGGQTPRSVTVAVDPAGLSVGRHQGQITFASANATSGPVSVDVALDVTCDLRSAVDVVLALDRSGSMVGTPFTDAKTAAKTFVDEMDLSVDQVSLVSFSSSARLDQPLTQDSTAIKNKIDSLSATGGTDIADAIRDAHSELRSSRHKPANQPVIVLLTDGKPDGSTAASALSAANTAKAQGSYIITVGLLGSVGLDSDLLRNIASTPADYYETPDSSELVQIYRDIAAQIGCPNLVVDPPALVFETDGSSPIATQTIAIRNRQGAVITWTGSDNQPWLSLGQATGSTPATVNVTVNANGLLAGTYTGQISIASPSALNSPQTVDVTFAYLGGGDPADSRTYLPLIVK